MKACKCIEQCDAEFERLGENTRMHVPIQFDMQTGKVATPRMCIATVKADAKKRQQPATVMATYCPVCGKKYPK